MSIQIPDICGGGGGGAKNNKQTLESKEGLKAAAFLLNIPKYRENGEDSVFFPSNRIKIGYIIAPPLLRQASGVFLHSIGNSLVIFVLRFNL